MRPIRIAIAILSVLVVPSVAWAHAAYKDSDPKDEATVASPPSSVWAEYTEPLQDGSNLEVYDPCGTRVDNDDTSITAYRMEVTMSADKAGTYSVRWVAASAVDPHVTRGTFTFSVTDGDTCDVATAPEDDGQQRGNTSRGNNSASSVDTADAGAATTDRRERSQTERAQGPNARERAGARQNAAAVNDTGLVQAQDTESEVGSDGIWDGIPMDGFALALAIAAAIGAAGGRIYANIMGPRR